MRSVRNQLRTQLRSQLWRQLGDLLENRLALDLTKRPDDDLAKRPASTYTSPTHPTTPLAARPLELQTSSAL